MVERCVRDAEAAGSSPVASTIKKQVPFRVSAFLSLITGLEPVKVLALIKQSSGLFLAKSGEVGTVANATVGEPLVCKAKP